MISYDYVYSDGSKAPEGKAYIGGPSCQDLQDRAERVVMLQADGDELAAIIRIFTLGSPPGIVTVPISNSRVQRWHGDMAKTIAWALGSSAKNAV